MSVSMALIHIIASRRVALQLALAQTDRGRRGAVRAQGEVVSNTEPVKPAAEDAVCPLCPSREMPPYEPTHKQL